MTDIMNAYDFQTVRSIVRLIESMSSEISPETMKFIVKLIESVPPEISHETINDWTVNPVALQNALRSVLCLPEVNLKKRFSPWRTIEIGTLTLKNLLNSVLNGKFKIGHFVQDLLRQTEIVAVKAEIELVNVSLLELGFENGAILAQIYAIVSEFDLGLVPSEVGPQLLLQYPEQPFGEKLMIGMEPMMDDEDEPRLFRIVRDNSQHLTTCDGRYDYHWPARSHWVFARESAVII